MMMIKVDDGFFDPFKDVLALSIKVAEVHELVEGFL